MDIKAHNNVTETIVKHIRNWLFTNTGRKEIPSVTRIMEDYKNFTDIKLPIILRESHSTITDLTFNDFCKLVINSLVKKMEIKNKL